jgi:hypothetical protein
MALTDAQKDSVRQYMGWTFRFRQTDSQLELALNAVDADATVQATVIGMLAVLANVDTLIVAAYARIKAKSIDEGDVVLMESQEIAILRSEGRRGVGRLAGYLGVPVRQDVYGSALPTHFAGYHGPYGGGTGNLPRLG